MWSMLFSSYTRVVLGPITVCICTDVVGKGLANESRQWHHHASAPPHTQGRKKVKKEEKDQFHSRMSLTKPEKSIIVLNPDP